MKAPSLDDLLTIAAVFVARHLVDTKNNLSPTWIVPTPGEMKVILTPWASELERQVMLASIRRVLSVTGASTYLIMSEVWLVRHEGPEYPRDAPQPRHDPRRQEKVAAYAVARTGERRARLWGIKRDYKGMIRMLIEEDAQPAPASMGGPLVTMFEDARCETKRSGREEFDG